ncbi:MAG TPA: aminotransferase class V-fold PLP-dependent enzyme, partial [Actinomycetota bacterium]|nr:aminotransferase class V-fold PLP-dependent enzyme [Actinomycetota bacterium]
MTGSPPAPRDLASYRDEFEVVRRKAYLISASLGPVGDRSRRYLDDYVRAWATKGAPDHVWFEDIFPAMGRLKRSFAGLCGCDEDEVALTTNISIALSTVASALDLSGERNRIVLSELDFPTDGQVWQAWSAKTGAELVWLRSADRMTIPLERYDDAIDERTGLVMVNRVLYRSSAITDAKAICWLARERGALSLVDDYHGIGVIPLDLHDLGCDLYVAGTLKFLCGGPGCVFFYCRRDLLASLEPAVTGWFATADPFSFDTEHPTYHPTARRLEHGTPPAPVFFIAQGGIDVVAEVGVDRIRQRQWELQERVIEHADRLGLAVRTPR